MHININQKNSLYSARALQHTSEEISLLFKMRTLYLSNGFNSNFKIARKYNKELIQVLIKVYEDEYADQYENDGNYIYIYIYICICFKYKLKQKMSK